MGQKHTHPIDDGRQPSPQVHLGAPMPETPSPTPFDIESDGNTLCDRFPDVFDDIRRTADIILPSKFWRLLYTTRGGRSFPRMVRHICNGGPTVTVIELSSTSPHRRIIVTAVNRSSWKMAAERKGSKDVSDGAAAKKTSPGFFGDSSCIVHIMDLDIRSATLLLPKYSSSTAPPVPSASNYMYLVDDAAFALPPAEVGIGMGGLAGRWGWFVGEDLEYCRLSSAATFREAEGPLLDASIFTLEWSVEHFDVFALEPDAHRPLEARRNMERRHLVKCFAMDAAGVSGEVDGNKKSILSSQSARTAMAVLQLGGAHTSYSEREDVCERPQK